MVERQYKREEVLDIAKYLGMGFYRVTEEGQFVECDAVARKVFGIPPDEKDLSKFFLKDMYVAPAERNLRIEKLLKNKSAPLSGTLSLRIHDKNKLVFDICRYEESYEDGGVFVGMAAEIEESTIFPKMFDTFPMGLYEIDNENKVVRVNDELVKILKYKNEVEILKRDIADFYVNKDDLNKLLEKIRKYGYAREQVELKDANNEAVKVECFTKDINAFELARWGMVVDVTERERYYRALDRMASGSYTVRYEGFVGGKHRTERISDCNIHFAKILGFENVDEVIGLDVRELYAVPGDGDAFFEALDNAAKSGKSVKNYLFKLKRRGSSKPVTVSVDSQLLKNPKGKVIGREGTIRDVTREHELKEKVEETQSRLKRVTDDTSRLMHALLHPVLKVSSNLELIYSIGRLLHDTLFKNGIQPDQCLTETGKELKKRLEEIAWSIPHDVEKCNDMLPSPDCYPDENNKKRLLLAIQDLRERLIVSLNIYDHALKTEDSEVLLDSEIRDLALGILEELFRIGYFKGDSLESIVSRDLVNFMQDILFSYFTRNIKILIREVQVMKRKVDTLRKFIGMNEEKKYYFSSYNLGRLLEENVERFKQVLLSKGIKINYKASGSLDIEMSKSDIDRVICNLFHNAQKYSLSGERRFVNVCAKELAGNAAVEFSIESYGLPIKSEEIESGYIFNVGTRSEFASRSDRDGTGIGLADAKEITEAHGGNIELTSEPVTSDGDPPEYKVPYRTTVTIRLPKTRKEKNA